MRNPIFKSEAESELKELCFYFGIELTEENVSKLSKLLLIHDKLERGGFVLDSEAGESQDEHLRRVRAKQGKTQAILALKMYVWVFGVSLTISFIVYI